MHGLCHNCFTSGTKIEVIKGRILCKKCIEKNNAKN